MYASSFLNLCVLVSLCVSKVIDFLPIWYEKRGGKVMLPGNMDRSFQWKFAAHFFAYSVLGGIRDWSRVADQKLRAKDRARSAAALKDAAAHAQVWEGGSKRVHLFISFALDLSVHMCAYAFVSHVLSERIPLPHIDNQFLVEFSGTRVPISV
jgi:hypothetical protein